MNRDVLNQNGSSKCFSFTMFDASEIRRIKKSSFAVGGKAKAVV